MGPWNALSNNHFDALTNTTTPLAPTAGGVPAPINGTAQLEQQSILGSYDQSGTASSSSTSTTPGGLFRTVSTNCIGWADYSAGCTTTNQYGWYLPLGTGYANANDPPTSRRRRTPVQRSWMSRSCSTPPCRAASFSSIRRFHPRPASTAAPRRCRAAGRWRSTRRRAAVCRSRTLPSTASSPASMARS